MKRWRLILECLLVVVLVTPFTHGEAAERSDASAWVKAITPNLDLKLNYSFEDSEDEKERHRFMFRWRAGADVSLHDYVTMGFGLASGGSNARSTNRTFSSKPIFIEYAYARFSYG